MAEQLLFDPVAEITGSELDVMASPYAVTAMNFPAPPLETVTAGSIDTEGDAIAGRRHQNRQVTMTVEVVGSSQANLDSLVGVLEAKIAKVAMEGGTLRRVRTDGTYRTLDLLAADTYEPVFDVKYMIGNLAEVNIGLVAKPYARGVEATVGTYSANTTAALSFTATVSAGSVSALGRMVVTAGDSATWYNVRWGLEEDYAPGVAGALAYDLTNTTYFTAQNGAASTSDATAVGGTALLQGSLTTGYVSQVAWAGAMAHQGTYRVFVRARSPSGSGGNYLRLAYGRLGQASADLAANPPVLVPQDFGFGATYYLVDLGIINVPKPAKGAANWIGRIDALADTAGDDVYMDAIYLFPATLYGRAKTTAGNLSPISSSRPWELRHNGQDAQVSSTTWEPVAYEGDYLRLPAGTARILVKLGKSLGAGVVGTADWTSDGTATPAASVTLYATPRYLSVF